MKTQHLFSTAAMLLALSAASAKADMIVNGGFETGSLSPWFQDRDFDASGVNWHITNSDAHTGTFSATDVGNKEIRQNFAATPNASILEVSFWLKHPGGNRPAFVDLFYSDSTDTGFLVSTTTSNWEFFNVTANLAAGKSLVGFSVFGYSGGGDTMETFLDDVTVRTEANQAVPEPATMTMLAFGAIGLAGYGWRRRKPTIAV